MVKAPPPAPMEWHKSVARVGGELSLAITRRALKGPQLQNWIVDLRAVADQMERFQKANNRELSGKT